MMLGPMAHVRRTLSRLVLAAATMSIVGGCGGTLFPPPGPGSKVDFPGHLAGVGYASDPTCVRFTDEDAGSPGTWDLIALPDGVIWSPAVGLVRSGASPFDPDRFVVLSGQRARVVGHVATKARESCPGTPLIVEQIERLGDPTGTQ